MRQGKKGRQIYFALDGLVDVWCRWRGWLLGFLGHYDFGGKYPKCNAGCKHCDVSDYVERRFRCCFAEAREP